MNAVTDVADDDPGEREPLAALAGALDLAEGDVPADDAAEPTAEEQPTSDSTDAR